MKILLPYTTQLCSQILGAIDQKKLTNFITHSVFVGSPRADTDIDLILVDLDIKDEWAERPVSHLEELKMRMQKGIEEFVSRSGAYYGDLDKKVIYVFTSSAFIEYKPESDEAKEAAQQYSTELHSKLVNQFLGSRTYFLGNSVVEDFPKWAADKLSDFVTERDNFTAPDMESPEASSPYSYPLADIPGYTEARAQAVNGSVSYSDYLRNVDKIKAYRKKVGDCFRRLLKMTYLDDKPMPERMQASVDTSHAIERWEKTIGETMSINLRLRPEALMCHDFFHAGAEALSLNLKFVDIETEKVEDATYINMRCVFEAD